MRMPYVLLVYSGSFFFLVSFFKNALLEGRRSPDGTQLNLTINSEVSEI